MVSTDNALPVSPFDAGAFDNIYYNSPDGTGNMYVCGTNGTSGLAALWRIPIIAGIMQTPVAGPTLTTVAAACSPVTEFFNPNITSLTDPNGTDFIYLSVTDSPQTNFAINCPFSFPGMGCIMSFDVTTPGPTQTTATTYVTGGTSGIIVDGSSSVGGASQVYFSPLSPQSCTTSRSTGGCAIQASQSGLN